MYKLPLATLATALLAVTACDTTLPDFDLGGDDDPYWDDSGLWDTATPDAASAPLISAIDWQCDPYSGTWTYYAETSGWASDITLDVFETGSTYPWQESHDLRNIGYADDGSWDQWEISLNEVENAGSVVSNSSTLFRCGYHADDSLTWMMTSYDEDGRVADCAVWGHRPSYWTSDRGYSDCLNWN